MEQHMNLYYEVLDEKRRNILDKLSNFKIDFYLAGGTALALQLGHRDSIDFDFFTDQDFDENKLIEKIGNVFGEENTQIIQVERGTVSAIVDEEIKLSFFRYKYTMIDEFVNTEHMRLASVMDIACMKLSAICSRSTNKDYVDLYFILNILKLDGVIDNLKVKFKTLDIGVVLKSLVYFEDIENEPLLMYKEKDITMIRVQEFLKQKIKEYTKLG